MKILIINGPNLNLLGRRETDIYGSVPFKDYMENLHQHYPDMFLEYFQSNHEGEIIDKLHQAGFSYDGIILNAGGYTHTSVSIADAVRAVDVPVVEVHISNTFDREKYRKTSLIAPYCIGIIIGFGLDSYKLALESFNS